MRFFLAHLTHYVAKAIYALLAHFCREKIYALRPESFCAKNSANRKVLTFCVSEGVNAKKTRYFLGFYGNKVHLDFYTKR